MDNLFLAAEKCINASNIEQKLELTQQTFNALKLGDLDTQLNEPPVLIGDPGRPLKPELVATRGLPRRRMGSVAGCAALIHSFVHIEFNAINLAWDAVYRFRGMPLAYYQDWAHVAVEEAYHFGLLRSHLNSLGYDYGDFVAHDGLWDVARETAHDVLVRMSVVPRVLEARGLDATPAIIDRFNSIGDKKAAAILKIILQDEIGHVAIGTRWFVYLCEQRGLDREKTFVAMINDYVKERIKGPLHVEARIKAGFNAKEIAYLDQLVN
ncbi:MAG: ferritin-like domain-containing protein [Gammaproteobacteria bacterium]|nr:ferritin-like domain-containing protein [Gammaproteobacteria bacterium]